MKFFYFLVPVILILIVASYFFFRKDKKTWPNDQSWHALKNGTRLQVANETFYLKTLSVGEIQVPSGKLVVCDPFTGMKKDNNPYLDIPKGTYPVQFTLADVSGKGDGSHFRIAYASILLSDSPELYRKILVASHEGTLEKKFKHDEYEGFSVDAGLASFVDQQSITSAMPPEDEWEDLFLSGSSESWFSQVENNDNAYKRAANITLPLSKNNENIILFESGWGDGFYPIIGGYDKNGNLVAIHVDLMVLNE